MNHFKHKVLKLFSSTSNMLGKFFRINKPHEIQSVNKNLHEFHFPNHNRIHKKVVMEDTVVLILVKFALDQNLI
jgi:hypothetical protein